MSKVSLKDARAPWSAAISHRTLALQQTPPTYILIPTVPSLSILHYMSLEDFHSGKDKVHSKRQGMNTHRGNKL
jgi:hypothetical protein